MIIQADKRFFALLRKKFDWIEVGLPTYSHLCNMVIDAGECAGDGQSRSYSILPRTNIPYEAKEAAVKARMVGGVTSSWSYSMDLALFV